MSADKPMFTVYIVDDDPGVIKALERRLRVKGYDTLSFTSTDDFLRGHDAAVPGCVILDLSMPGMNGLELQQALTSQGSQRPVIFLTGNGDIPTSVRAMRAGAVDFLTKPVNDESFLGAIRRAEEQDRDTRQTRDETADTTSRLATLTPREHEVLTHVVAGRLNKQIAVDLGTAVQTIKVHRRRAMEKLGATSIVHLMRLLEKIDISKPSSGN
ncbi:Transcriptional regulatory protein FixJ OS=Afipia felis OX=1035 GN=fixJ_3 PE=4 SV=1 [Afipia felis]